MEIRNGTQVFLGFASRNEEHIKLINELLKEHSKTSYNAFLTAVMNTGEETGIHFDGKIQPSKVYDRFLARANADNEEWHCVTCEFNAKGLVSSDLRSTTVKALNKRFGSNEVKFYYLDEYRKINSDEEGIVFSRRIKVDFSVYCYPWIRTEYYSSVDELVENPMYAKYGLDDIYEMTPDEIAEIEEKIADDYDNIFDIEITAYQYGYDAINNDLIIQFNDLFKK